MSFVILPPAGITGFAVTVPCSQAVISTVKVSGAGSLLLISVLQPIVNTAASRSAAAPKKAGAFLLKIVVFIDDSLINVFLRGCPLRLLVFLGREDTPSDWGFLSP